MAELKFNIVYDRKKVATDKKLGVLEFRFSMERKQKYFSTGIKIAPKQWKNETIVFHLDAVALNKRLNVMRTKALDIVNKSWTDDFDFNSIGRLFKGDSQQQQDFISYCEQRTQKRNVCESTKERYRVFTRFLRSWGAVKDFADLSVSKIRSLDKYLHSQGVRQSTVYNYHKYMKLFINDAVIDGLVAENPYRRLPFKISRGDKQYVDCLTEKQFEAVRSVSLTSPHLVKARDLFLFQCYTGLAFADLMSFDFNECTIVDGKYFYHDKRVKTSVDFVLQLLPQALGILKKYDFLLPKISNQKYNDYLKVIGVAAGVEGLHSHMGRATAATLFLSKGMPINIVARVLGHTNIRQTQRYARTLSRDVRNAFDSIEDRL